MGVAGQEVVAVPKGEETLVVVEGALDCCSRHTAAVEAGNTSGAAAAAVAAAAGARGRSCTEAGAAGAVRAEAARETVAVASGRILPAAAAAARTG